MSDQLLAPEVRDFLTRHIDSIVQLECLLLMHGAPNVAWPTQAVADRLYTSEREAADTLGHLTEQGFLVRAQDGYRFAPRSHELAPLVDIVAQSYRRHLIPITNHIHAKPRRIRQFADAFKLKKD